MSTDKLHARLRASETYSFLKLRGVVDEDNSLDALVPRLSGDVLVVDTTDVVRINSCGVRDWVNWLSAVQKMGVGVVLIRCSPAIVNQINLVTNFSGHSVVHSFFAPYYCESCDREIQKIIPTDTLLGGGAVHSPSFRCNDCGSALEFDDIEESYFAFINATDPDAIDHRLKRLVDEVSPDLEAKIRALNEAGSAPLSGPLHTIGGLTEDGPDVRTPQAEPAVPASYLDIDEEGHTPVAIPVARPTKVPIADADSTDSVPVRRVNRMMIALVISAVVVVLLLVYLAATGV